MRKLCLLLSTVLIVGLGHLATAPQAQAGCRINLGTKNTGTQVIYVHTGVSQVKSKSGSWRRLSRGDWHSVGGAFTLQAGAEVTDGYRAVFGCSKKRRYRIQYNCGSSWDADNVRTTYYPSPGGWSTKQSLTIDLSC